MGFHGLPFDSQEYSPLGWFEFDWKTPGLFGNTNYMVILPHWFLALIFATLPAIWLYKWNKRRKLGPNACPSCGYDLTGNETGECPECGVTTKPEAAHV